MNMDGIREQGLSPVWTTASECIIFLFAIVCCLEKIHDLYYLVIVLDALTAFLSFFFIILWFFMNRTFHSDAASVSLGVMTLAVLVSSIVRSSDVPRLLVASYALIESWALMIAVMILSRRIERVITEVYALIIIFSILYCIISLYYGIENEEARFSGLSDQTNSLAVVASSSCVICLALIKERKSILVSVLSNVFLVSAVILFAYTLAKTDSRTSFFALVVSLAFFIVLELLFSRDAFSLVLSGVISAVLICTVVVFLLSSTRSEGRVTLSSLTSGRTDIWSGTLSRMEAEDYLFGFGGNSAEMAETLEERGMDRTLAEYLGEDHLMHNIYLQFLVEYGIVSAAAFVTLSLFLFASALGVMRRRSSSRPLLIPSLTLLLFFLVHSLAESSIYFIGGEEQFLFLLSISVIYSFYRTGSGA